MNFGITRPHRRKYRSAGRRKNWLPLLVFCAIIGLFLWAIVHFISILLVSHQSNSLSAEIQILKGNAEFTLEENQNWTPAYSEQKFFAGDSVRTKTNTRISLKITGGDIIFLDQNTELKFSQLEQKASNRKNIVLKLKQGQLWAKISDDNLIKESKSSFEIQTNRLNLHIRGTIFALSTEPKEDTIRLIRGNVDVDVLDNKEVENVKVGVGQKLTISKDTFNKLKKGEEVLKIIDSDFIESEWHIQNLGKFYPQEAAQIRRKIEISASQKIKQSEENKMEASDDRLTPPEILSPKNEAHIPSDTEVVKIEGTAPPEATQIVVNGFTLTKFQPGDRKWSYFAAKKFGTLVPGENSFSVYAISRDGKKSEAASVIVFYDGEEPLQKTPESIPSKKAPSNIDIDKFVAPTIIGPAIIANEGVYETSSDVVTITGTVDPKTNTVKVNGYKLKKFQPGDTEFTYIASSRYGSRSNLKEGNNKYEILALGPDGKSAATVVRIIYTPVEVPK